MSLAYSSVYPESMSLLDINNQSSGDSWRARASFVPELQLSLASGAMKIDFGGLDRWDNNERQRNLADSTDVQL